jgi:hypothetical protein
VRVIAALQFVLGGGASRAVAIRHVHSFNCAMLPERRFESTHPCNNLSRTERGGTKCAGAAPRLGDREVQMGPSAHQFQERIARLGRQPLRPACSRTKSHLESHAGSAPKSGVAGA